MESLNKKEKEIRMKKTKKTTTTTVKMRHRTLALLLLILIAFSSASCNAIEDPEKTNDSDYGQNALTNTESSKGTEDTNETVEIIPYDEAIETEIQKRYFELFVEKY